MTQRNNDVDVINQAAIMAAEQAIRAIEIFMGAHPNPPGQTKGNQPQITQAMIKSLGKGG